MNVSDDFVWNAILRHLPGNTRSKGSSLRFNCPMCVRRGETPDKRLRCAAYHDSEGIGVNCFNCGYKGRYVVGTRMAPPFREFLEALGIPDDEVKRIAFRAASIQHTLGMRQQDALPRSLSVPLRPPVSLPPEARPITALAEEGCTDPDFVHACGYLLSRGEAVLNAIDYHWSPCPSDNLRHRIIVPFREHGRIVGWSGRATKKDVSPKYYSQEPKNFVFNSAALWRSQRRYVIVVEGLFDALALDAVGVLGADMNESVISQINASPLQRIVLPDRDVAGQRLIDHALRLGWAVSFPALRSGHGDDDWWHPDVKDAADAAQRYGRLYALRSVIESATSNPAKIAQRRKLL